MAIDNLPVYYVNFDDTVFESGIDLIALTTDPAIEVMAMRFSKNKTGQIRLKFDSEKKTIIGPAIIPDKKIYRNGYTDAGVNVPDHYVVFTKNIIEKMVEKFNSEQREIKFNIEHTEHTVKGFIKESWIIEDTKLDKSKLYGFDLPVGTWMISAKIEDEEVWDNIKNLDEIGFSIEGLMGMQKQKLNKNKRNNMKKRKFIASKLFVKTKFNKKQRKFETEIVETDEQEVLITDALEEGKAVEALTDEGTIETAEDGVYVIPEEEVQITIEEGVIESVVEIEVTEDETPAEETFEDETKDEDEKKEELEDETPTESDYDALVARIAEIESKLDALTGKVEDEIEDDEVKFRKNKKSKTSAIDTLLAFNRQNNK